MVDKKMFEVRCRKCGNIVALCGCDNPDFYKTEKTGVKSVFCNPDIIIVKGFQEHKSRRIQEIRDNKKKFPKLVNPGSF